MQENVTCVSPKIINNEVSCKSVPKQAVFQNRNNLQDTQESQNRKSMTQEKFHRNADRNAAKSPKLESQRPNSVVLECVDDEDTEEALKQERQNLCLNSSQGKLRAAFHSSTKVSI